MYLKSQHYYNLAWNIIKSMKYQQQKKVHNSYNCGSVLTFQRSRNKTSYMIPSDSLHFCAFKATIWGLKKGGKLDVKGVKCLLREFALCVIFIK